MPAPTLELSLRFALLARRPDVRRLLRRWDVCVSVDGALHVFQEGPKHVLPIAPGPHRIEVWFRGAGLALLARPIRFGRRSLAIVAPDHGTVRLVYEGSTFWHMGGAAELRLVPRVGA